jgi:hypothetical protein
VHFSPEISLFSCPWIRVRIPNTDPDPQSHWIRIQSGSGSTTLLKRTFLQKSVWSSVDKKQFAPKYNWHPNYSNPFRYFSMNQSTKLTFSLFIQISLTAIFSRKSQPDEKWNEKSGRKCYLPRAFTLGWDECFCFEFFAKSLVFSHINFPKTKSEQRKLLRKNESKTFVQILRSTIEYIIIHPPLCRSAFLFTSCMNLKLMNCETCTSILRDANRGSLCVTTEIFYTTK